MEIKVGQIYKATNGEIMEITELTDKEFTIDMRNPRTKLKSGFVMSGDRNQLNDFFKEVDAQLIDLESYEPTGPLAQ